MRPLTILSAVLALGLGAAEARAQPDISRAFGNTIMSTYPDGRQAEVWLEPGGVYRSNGRRGQNASGVWRLRGGRLCLRQQRPYAAPMSYCTPIPEQSADAWTARAPTGETVEVRLLAGHVSGRKGEAPR
jgi:hypothetical protein